jgi:hypothetical protein
MPILTLTLQIERGKRAANITATALLDPHATPRDTRAATTRLIEDVLAQISPRVPNGQRRVASHSPTTAPP